MKIKCKKIIVSVITFVMGLCIAACGSAKKEDTASDNVTTETFEENTTVSDNTTEADEITNTTSEYDEYEGMYDVRMWTEDFVPPSDEYWCLWLVVDELKLDDYTDIYGNEHQFCDLVMPEWARQYTLDAAYDYQKKVTRMSEGRAKVHVAIYEMQGEEEIVDNTTYYGEYNCFDPSNLPEKVRQIGADYDHIMMILPNVESICDAGGLTVPDIIYVPNGDDYYYTTSSYLPVYIEVYDEYTFSTDYFVECCIHEWLHTLERFDGQYGCSIPDSSVIDWSFTYGYEEENGSFMHYYKDFMMGTINGNIGMTEEAWDHIIVN